MGYQKTFQTKIIRTKHRVTFSIGTRKIDLMESLKNVPDNAAICEFVEGSDDSNGISYIEFIEEKPEVWED